MGIIFMVMGLVNRKKWKEQAKWSELSPEKKRAKMIVVIGITILVLLGIIAYIIESNT